MTSVTILMGAYNGEKYISEQLDSIFRQHYSNWKLIVSDDGSTDRTLEILNRYLDEWPTEKINLREGPGLGFCKNFLSMACNPSLSSNYYAFSDQDDLWKPEKLSLAIDWLDSIPSNTPAVYCGRTLSIDNNYKELGLSPLFTLPPSFRNALVQNIGGGNTMIFNEAARKLLVIAGVNIDVPSHDWWLYILVTGVGGVVKYDPVPTLFYRQHDKNIVGENLSFRARSSRFLQLIKGRYRGWNEMHLTALVKISKKFTPENQQLLNDFENMRNSELVQRFRAFKKSRVYRQTTLGHLALFIAVLFKKV